MDLNCKTEIRACAASYAHLLALKAFSADAKRFSAVGILHMDIEELHRHTSDIMVPHTDQDCNLCHWPDHYSHQLKWKVTVFGTA